jgi:hypothetical protein
MLNGDRGRLELAYSLMLTLPGTPGQPIQLGDNQHVILFELIQQLDETRPLLNGGTAGHPI